MKRNFNWILSSNRKKLKLEISTELGNKIGENFIKYLIGICNIVYPQQQYKRVFSSGYIKGMDSIKNLR